MVNILDCTIRDGSYVTKYMWDNDTLKTLVLGLSKAGVEYIEIGNGMGLGMYRKKTNAKSDKEYIDNTIKYKNNAKIGAFFIPTIGTYDDILNFKTEGGDFIRIGVNATETELALPYVEYAKKMGLEVFCNLMKTYSITIYQFAYAIKPLIESGADCIYIVDSAGGMTPQQVGDYCSVIREIYDISLGFHGHNNLLLANANSYMAAINGAKFVDGTLMSIGRGSGNAQIESMTALLQKEKMLYKNIDINILCDLSEKVICELQKKNKINIRQNIAIGLANFHDSNLPIAEKYAKKYNIETEVLISKVSKVNMVSPSDDLFHMVAFNIANNNQNSIINPKFYHKEL